VAAIEGKMSWLITGASGQLGKSLIRLLGYKGVPHLGVTKSEIDISSPDATEKLLMRNPSVIVNCAAYTAVDRAEVEKNLAFKVNGNGAGYVALAARELSVPLVHISTDYIFSGNKVFPWHINDATEPLSQYGSSKLEGEQQILELYPENSFIMRTAWLYGPYGRNFAKTILKKAINSKDEIFVTEGQIGQPTSTIDLALQIYKSMVYQIPAGVYHATNSGQATWYEFAREIVALSGESVSRVKPLKSPEFHSLANRPSYSVLDHSCWQATPISGMNHWRIALENVFPLVFQATEGEIKSWLS